MTFRQLATRLDSITGNADGEDIFYLPDAPEGSTPSESVDPSEPEGE